MNASAIDASFVDVIDRFFREQSSPEVVAEAEDSGLNQGLWGMAVDMGLPHIGITEEAGGAGGTLLDIVTVLTSQGRAAAALPLMETNTAAWAMAESGLDLPAGPLSPVTPDPRDVFELTDRRLSGRAHGVPWARDAVAITAIVEKQASPPVLVVIPMDRVQVEHGRDLANQPKDTIVFDQVEVKTAPWVMPAEALRWRALLTRGAMVAGALQEISTITRRFVSEREQFGRPIGKFQSVQAHVVHLEQASTLSHMAVDRAAEASVDNTTAVEVLLMKSVLDEIVPLAVRAAHQAHGAIGMTKEYRLQQLTRRLNTWLHGFGSYTWASSVIGSLASERGIYSMITSGLGRVEVPHV